MEIKTIYIKMTSLLRRWRKLILIFIIGLLNFVFCTRSFAQDKKLVIRIAKLRIDSIQLETYKTALKEAIETAVRVEPGVLSLYAVSDKNNPVNITVFEIYADQDAYKSHLESAHFKKYKSTTKEMVKSLELTDTVPIALESKPKQ